MKKQEKRLQRALSLLCSTALVFSLTACDDAADGPADSAPTSTTSTSESNVLEGGLYETTGVVSGNLDAKGLFYADYSSSEELQRAAQELHIQMCEEGQVLLKNGDGNAVLPLAQDEKNITLFGVSSVSFSVGGTGSGATRQKAADDPNAPSYTWQTGFEAAGFNVNPKTIDLYTSFLKTQSSKLTAGDHQNPDISLLGPSVSSTYGAFNDAGIIILSRIGAENDDLDTHDVVGHSNLDDHYLQLTDNEVELVKHVKQHFDKVIVIINSSNVMQIPELAESKTDSNLGVDAILWVGGVGNAGTFAAAQIIDGTANPSGHTVSVWEKDMTQAPYWTNFSENSQNKDENGNRMDSFFYYDGKATQYVNLEYREGIYTDYRYYETGYDDKNAEEEGAGTAWYDDQVLYPFGYGLSYTTFEWELAGVSENTEISNATQKLAVQVKVTNTGDVAGKDVVQLYYNPPYTSGGIEKASANLVAFEKTNLLAPGESQVLTLEFVAQNMASFDWNDANSNGFKGYELEAGTYVISARRNSHDVALTQNFTIEETILCKTDYISGNEITPVFVDDYTTVNDSLLDNMISRATGMVQPVAPTVEDRTLTEDEFAILESSDYYYPYMDDVDQDYYVSEVPESWTQGMDTDLTLSDLTGKTYVEAKIGEDDTVTEATDADSKLWKEYMNSLTYDELFSQLTSGASGANGPVQLSGSTCWQTSPITAATFNKELVSEQGKMYANEALFKGIEAWYGNGCDIHRTPFSGRNFEYYSADPYLSGIMAAQVVRECTEKGIICMVKHFFGNDQEYARNQYGGVATFATEQTFREISAKPFQMAVQLGNSLSLMTAFNRIGWITESCNRAVHEDLLRDEWGFTGFTCTDAWSTDHWSLDLTYRAGDDAMMSAKEGGKTGYTKGVWDATARDGKGMVRVPTEDETNTILSPTQYYAVRTSAQRVLYAYANSINTKNFADELNLSVDLVYGENNTATITCDGSTDVSVKLQEADAAETEESAFELPAGLSLDGMTVNYIEKEDGTWLEEGVYTIPVTLSMDGWITDVNKELTVRVVSPITYNGMSVVGSEPIELSAGQDIDATISSDFYAYYTEHSGGRVMHWFRNEEVGAFVQPGDRFECLAYEPTASDEQHLAQFELVSVKDAEGNDVAGITAEKIIEPFIGKGAVAYDINTGLKLSGAFATAGTYEITVSYNVPLVGWFGSGWYRLPGNDNLLVKTFTVTVK